MQTLPIPLNSKTLKNVDEFGLDEESADCVNFYANDTGGLSKVPGLLTQLSLVSTPTISGMFWWGQVERAFVLTDYHIYKINYDGVNFTATDLSPPATYLVSGGRPTWSTARITGGTTTQLFMANGAKIHYSDGVAAFQAIADADCPTRVTHVVHMDGYLVCNNLDDPTRIHFSNSNDPTNWAASDFISAESDPDNVLALHLWNGEIYAFGTRTTEVIERDPTAAATFKRIPGGVIRSGLSAVYSVVPTDNEIYWLDDKRRFVRYRGNLVERISSPYDKEIQRLGQVSDCYAFQIEFEGNSFIFFNFVAEDKTYVYNVKQETWERWGTWNSDTYDYTIWPGNAYCYSGLWSKHLVGESGNGYISLLSSDYYSNNGLEIRSLKRTGHIDHGTGNKKRSHKIRFRARRGVGLSDRTPYLMVRWKDDNRAWGPWKTVSLGDVGDTRAPKELATRGIYKQRQWEFACSDNVPLSLFKLEEDVTVL